MAFTVTVIVLSGAVGFLIGAVVSAKTIASRAWDDGYRRGWIDRSEGAASASERPAAAAAAAGQLLYRKAG